MIHTFSVHYAYFFSLPLLTPDALHICAPQQFDPVIAALLEGQPVDLCAMPPPPPASVASASVSVGQKEDGERQHASEDITVLSDDQTSPSTDITVLSEDQTSPSTDMTVLSDDQVSPSTDIRVSSDEPEVDIYSAPPAPVSVMEALEQRLSKYRSVEQAARDEGNASKARRIGRIVKQYENAIKLHSAGRPIPVDELPTPPGMYSRDRSSFTSVQVLYSRCRD